MKKYTFCIFLNFIIFNIYSQNIDFSQFQINKNEIKGKLILINETHNVSTNNSAYFLIIKEITKSFVNSDTLNIFIERPYSLGLMYNKIVQNEDTLKTPKLTDFSQNKLPINAWLNSLASLKKNIRFVGVDFEYDDEGKRLKSYKFIFETLKDEFSKLNLPQQILDDYIQKINDKSIENNDIKQLKSFLITVPSKTKPIEDAIFILEAKHQFFGYRDKNNYERFRQIIQRNLDIKNQYNFLIYGGSHVFPNNSRNLFNLFNKKKESPFLGNTLLIANYYFDCMSYGWYGSKEPSNFNGGLYGSKGDEMVITELKKKDWKNGLFVIKNELTLPLQSFDKILYFVIHQE